jgi:hypothetical protein
MREDTVNMVIFDLPGQPINRIRQGHHCAEFGRGNNEAPGESLLFHSIFLSRYGMGESDGRIAVYPSIHIFLEGISKIGFWFKIAAEPSFKPQTYSSISRI